MTIIITLVLLLVVSLMGTSFTFLGGVAENKFTDNCNYDFRRYRVLPHLIVPMLKFFTSLRSSDHDFNYRHSMSKHSLEFEIC